MMPWSFTVMSFLLWEMIIVMLILKIAEVW